MLTGRESLVTDDQNALSQNLAAEGNGFEAANRNQFGAYIGRQRTNAFRMHHRLPVRLAYLPGMHALLIWACAPLTR